MMSSEGVKIRTGSGYVYNEKGGSSPRLLRLLLGALKTAMIIFLLTLFLDLTTWIGPGTLLPLLTGTQVAFTLGALEDIYITLCLTFQEHWPTILSATVIFLCALFICSWIKDTIVSYKIRWSRVDRWDTSGPTQYPDGYVFVTNRMTMEELERVKDETTRRELRALFRTPEWRAHLRQRGPDEAAYNWQKRKSEIELLEE